MYENGDRCWYLPNGQYHREDGPAIEGANGTKEWYINGKCHRTDGPAIEGTGGTKAWLLDGQLHREDGPALEYANGIKGWYLHGNQLTKAQFNAWREEQHSAKPNKLKNLSGFKSSVNNGHGGFN